VIERSDVDCVRGREIGCQTYCCCLLVRLEPGENKPEDNKQVENRQGKNRPDKNRSGEIVRCNKSLPAPGFIEKAKDGYCIYFERETKLCSVWHNRPKVCREFSCNNDELLQVALRESFTSLVDLVKKAQRVFIPKETYIRIPCCGDSLRDESKTFNK